ncbi:MAG TPA: UvrD-helicase domain-containing protein, partial [Microthrixaceae bacterium]|nr:UvrD-helicase domain-containing protein [Microthrixaceae bacterium]
GIVTQIFPPVSARAVVRRLMADRGFRESAADDLTHDELQRFDTEPSRKRQYRWSVADIPLIGEAAFVLSGAPDRYSHVIIDEAQDLSPMQWRMIRRRTAGRSMTIAGDLAQATSAWTPDTWSDVRRWAKLGKHLDVSELSLGYRVPIPIMEYAGRLLAYCAPAVNLPQSFRPGVDPVAHRVESSNVIDTALEIAHRWSDLPGSLAIICPPSLETKIRNAVTESDLPDSVEVVNDTVVKGLEFDRILVLEPSLIARGGINGLRRLYICLTRATQELAVVHSQDLPDELGQPEDQQRQEQAVELRSRQREKQLKAPTGSKIWRGQVADEYPHAYRRWSSEEEALLRDELTRGMSVLEISEAHRRRPGGITSRIKKLGLKVDWNMRDLLGQSDQPDFGERPEQQHRPVEAPLDSSLTLHDALKVVINDKGNRWMSAKELAEEVNRLGLYKPSDGTPLDAKQVNARVRNYQAVFVRGDERIRLRDEPKD